MTSRTRFGAHRIALTGALGIAMGLGVACNTGSSPSPAPSPGPSPTPAPTPAAPWKFSVLPANEDSLSERAQNFPDSWQCVLQALNSDGSVVGSESSQIAAVTADAKGFCNFTIQQSVIGDNKVYVVTASNSKLGVTNITKMVSPVQSCSPKTAAGSLPSNCSDDYCLCANNLTTGATDVLQSGMNRAGMDLAKVNDGIFQKFYTALQGQLSSSVTAGSEIEQSAIFAVESKIAGSLPMTREAKGIASTSAAGSFTANGDAITAAADLYTASGGAANGVSANGFLAKLASTVVTAVPYLGMSASPYTSTAMPVASAVAQFNKSPGTSGNGNAAQATISGSDMVSNSQPNVAVTYQIFEYANTTDSVTSSSFTAAPAVGQCISVRNQTTSALTVYNIGLQINLPNSATSVTTAEGANDGTFALMADNTANYLYGVTIGGSMLGNVSESLKITPSTGAVLVSLTSNPSLAAKGDAGDTVSFCVATYVLGTSNDVDQAFRNNIAVGKYGAVEMLDMVTAVDGTDASYRKLLGTDIAYSNALLGQPAMLALLGSSVLQDSTNVNVVVNSSLMNVSNIYIPAFNLPSAVQFGVWTSADGKTWSSQNVAGFTAPNYGNQVVAVPGLASKSYIKVDLLSSGSATGFKPIVVQLE